MMGYYYPGYNMMGYGYGFSIFHVIGTILTVVFWFIVIALVVRLLRHGRRFGDRRHIWMQSSALDILKERYAKGEINKAEFEEKKKDLEA